MGRRRGRAVDGILILDKPAGMTSNAALQQARAIYFAAKAGHTGSLDPLATGVLPLCFGEATKFSGFLLEADKCYRSTLRLGVSTDTGDADGQRLQEQSAADVDRHTIEQVLHGFRGKIFQIPPMYSALKHQGKPLYELARNGIEIEREARPVTIYRLELLDFRPGHDAELDLFIQCSKGTYVRVLAQDLGDLLGCGAHVKSLRRTRVGPFLDKQAQSLEHLESLRKRRAFSELDALLLPIQSAVSEYPEVEVPEQSAFYLRKGMPVVTSGLPESGFVSLLEIGGNFIGVGEVLNDGRVTPRRLVV